jgi:sugar O-acyltransferase (sialic acid O-acetyltransferase NeuD family)
MNKVLIITDSNFSKNIVDTIISQLKNEVFGIIYIDNNNPINDYGLEFVGQNIGDISKFVNDDKTYKGIIAINNNKVRSEVYNKIISMNTGFNFVSMVHSTSVIGKNVKIGKGVIIMPKVVVNSDSVIGDFCIINSKSSLGHEGSLGDFSCLNEGVIVGGNFNLGEFSEINLGVKIIENINIGSHTIVEAGSLILKNFSDNKTISGIPAKIVNT